MQIYLLVLSFRFNYPKECVNVYFPPFNIVYWFPAATLLFRPFSHYGSVETVVSPVSAAVIVF